jgi:hypothetical protein
MSSPLPRSLDEHGHLSVSVNHLSDHTGDEVSISPVGAMDVDQPYRLVGTSFTGTTLDSSFWTATNSGTGSSVSAATPGIIVMTSGTANNGYANLTTVRQGRFIFAHPHKFRAILRVTDETVANSTRRWGAYTAAGGPPVVPVDGFWFELSDAGVLSVNHRNNSGTIVTQASGGFNGDISVYNVDTNVHAYEIIFFLGKADFLIDNVLVHTFRPTTTNMSSTYTLPCSFQASSQAISSSAVMEVWAGMILRLGRESSAPKTIYQNGAATAVVAKQGPGRLHRVIYGQHPNGGTITLYDALTATNTVAIIAPPNGAAPATFEFGMDFYTGLTYTTSTANMNVTFILE